MKSPLDIGISRFQKRYLPPTIRDILSDLSKREDIMGALLVEGGMGIVACDLPPGNHDAPDLLKALAMVEEWGEFSRSSRLKKVGNLSWTWEIIERFFVTYNG